MLLRLGEVQTAIDHLRDGNRLRVKEVEAIRFSSRLAQLGQNEQARRLFHLAEPLDTLSGTKPIDRNTADETNELLEAWVRAAIYFLDCRDILKAIKRLSCTDDPHKRWDAAAETRGLHNYLFHTVCLTLADEDRWQDFEIDLKEIGVDQPEDHRSLFRLLPD